MQFRDWDDIPEFMQNEAVRKYYDILQKRRFSLVLKRFFDIVLSIFMIIIGIGMLFYTRKEQKNER